MSLTASLNKLRANRELHEGDLSIPSDPVSRTFANGSEVRLALGPSDRPMLLLPVSDTELRSQPPESDGLKIEFAQYSGNRSGASYFLQVACASSDLETVFLDLVENICSRIRDGGACLPSFHAAIDDFRDLLRLARQPVDRNKVKGLFGELLFLSRVCRLNIDSVTYWTGPTGGRRDFLYPSAAVEIKTSEQSAGRSVEIHSLGQLDTDDAETLLLVYFRIEEDPGKGLTVSDLISQIEPTLDSTALFREKLKAAGYEQGNREPWDAIAWTVVETQPFHVIEGFPRVISSSFPDGPPAGVSNVTYSLDLMQAKEFEVPMSSVLQSVGS